jgi:hypothetical protein
MKNNELEAVAKEWLDRYHGKNIPWPQTMPESVMLEYLVVFTQHALATPASTARTDVSTRCVYCTNPIAQDDQGWKITATSRYLCHANGYGYGHVPNDAAPGSVSQAPDPLKDDSRCAVCAWPLAESAEKGCVRGNCSQRPLPFNVYDLERANREYIEKFGIPFRLPAPPTGSAQPGDAPQKEKP